MSHVLAGIASSQCLAARPLPTTVPGVKSSVENAMCNAAEAAPFSTKDRPGPAQTRKTETRIQTVEDEVNNIEYRWLKCLVIVEWEPGMV